MIKHTFVELIPKEVKWIVCEPFSSMKAAQEFWDNFGVALYHLATPNERVVELFSFKEQTPKDSWDTEKGKLELFIGSSGIGGTYVLTPKVVNLGEGNGSSRD